MKTNYRIVISLVVIAAAGVLFFYYKKVYPTKPVDAEDDTSSVVLAPFAAPADVPLALAPVVSMNDTSTFEYDDSVEVEGSLSKKWMKNVVAHTTVTFLMKNIIFVLWEDVCLRATT